MQLITIGYGALLIALGVIGYIASGAASVTALIPAFFGLPVVVLGALALKENIRMHAMHGAVLIGLLGFLGALRGVPDALRVLVGGEVERPAAAVSQGIMALASLVFVVLCVQSFIQARRNRKKAEADAAQA